MNSNDINKETNKTGSEEPVLESEEKKSYFGVNGEGESCSPPAPPAPRRTAKEKKGGVPVPLCIVLVLFAMLVTFMTTYVVATQTMLASLSKDGANDATNTAFQKIQQIEEVLGEDFLYEIDEENLADSTIKGYMYGLGDPYAEYFTKEEFEALTSDFNAEMQGIGISVTYNQDYNAIQIITVFPDSPAQKAGVLPGDIIAYIKLEGEDVSVASLGYTMAVNKLQGEAGTFAEFTVFRGEDLSQSVDFSIERGFITEYTVMHRTYSEDSTIGIITITSFDSKTPEQFKKAYDELLASGCTRLVIDVRNNPGGELVSVCTTLDMLVPEGPVIRTVDRDGNEEVVYTSDEEETDIPIAVLMNGNTASAGELFAATLRDYDKAVLVGELTFGKGSMQTTMSFTDGTAFKYTYRYYCPPTSDNYDGIGITPDVEASLSEEAEAKYYMLTDSEDTQLQAAVNELNK